MQFQNSLVALLTIASFSFAAPIYSSTEALHGSAMDTPQLRTRPHGSMLDIPILRTKQKLQITSKINNSTIVSIA